MVLVHKKVNIPMIGIILAGGNDLGFWPLSSKSRPKPFIELGRGKTLLQNTIDRMLSILSPEEIVVLTGIKYREITENITRPLGIRALYEPMERNTAACTILAALWVEQKFGDTTIICLPVDHYIDHMETFKHACLTSIHAAIDMDGIGMIGIHTRFPSTRYGYIKAGDEIATGVKRVDAFVEKPNITDASVYAEKKEYMWNSGVFACKVGLILEEASRLLPDVYNPLKDLFPLASDQQDYIAALSRVYPDLPSISIDKGILERSKCPMYVVPCPSEWTDIKDIDTLDSVLPKDSKDNHVPPRSMVVEGKDVTILGDDTPVMTIGLSDVIVAHSDKGILVMKKGKSVHIEKVVGEAVKKGWI